MTWFTEGGGNYAAYRPTYPPSLVEVLVAAAPSRGVAVDIGCGTGQLTTLLTSGFDRVIGIDPSDEQIRHAIAADGVEYRVGTAEDTGIADSSASLITVAQAAHWFDLPSFYREVRRIAVADAALALITYGVVVLDADLAGRFTQFYRDEIGPYWPAERRHVDNGYAELDFPFESLPVPDVVIERSLTLAEFIGYVSTWSAVRRAGDAGAPDWVDLLARDLAPIWGDGPRTVRWPVTVLLGRVNATSNESS